MTSKSKITQLILVNNQDRVIGYEEKMACHQGKDKLHRAFSIWVFNKKGETLIQQRSQDKMLWPLCWSNSCCSHPIKDEEIEKTLQCRLKEELGFSCPLEFVYKFEYRAEYKNVGAEHELCYVYRGFYDGPVVPNPKEVAEFRWLSLKQLAKEIKQNPEKFTPWFKLELKRFINAKNH
jgi:isopentenyl-diphosphate delta-isomerase